MATYSEIRDHVIEMLWSHWHELGVSSAVPRRHADDCIDPEPLIAFTAVHGDLDPRLRDESIDWVLRYGVYVSKARLKNVLADQGLLGDTHFDEYAALVEAKGEEGVREYLRTYLDEPGSFEGFLDRVGATTLLRQQRRARELSVR